ncbi:MAG: hypothetical protein PF961_23780 [Planctomycetota bacterium]|jgi:hypothetical protein|nr:hypothetical protein [Planctomycetota bacterium]
MLRVRENVVLPSPTPLSAEAMRTAFDRIRQDMHLSDRPAVTIEQPHDFSGAWNDRMDQLGARRGTWDELEALLPEA